MSRVTFVRQLHLVGFTTDHRSLILSVRRGAKSGSYEIAIDDDLLEALDDARAWLEESADVAEDGSEPEAPDHVERPTSALTVREVQDRLRRGLSLEQVAAQAGVEASWVARFAAPVLAEQTEVIRTVRDLRFVKARLGPSSWPVGESVYRNLVDRNVTAPREVLDRAWRARQLADGRWLVSFRYASRGRTLEPAWEYDPETGQLTARDRLATQLSYRQGRVPPTHGTAPATKGTKGVTTPASARSRASSGGTAAKRSGATSQKPAPARTAPEKAAAKRLASARKAARARMEADAERATRRNVKIARQAAKRPLRVVFHAPVPADDPLEDDEALDDLVDEPIEIEVAEVIVVEEIDEVADVVDDEDVEDDDEPPPEPVALLDLWSGAPEPEPELEPPPVPVLVFDDVASPVPEVRPRRLLRVRQPDDAAPDPAVPDAEVPETPTPPPQAEDGAPPRPRPIRRRTEPLRAR